MRSLTLLLLAASVGTAADLIPVTLPRADASVPLQLDATSAANADGDTRAPALARAVGEAVYRVAWRDGQVGDPGARVLISPQLVMSVPAGRDPVAIAIAAGGRVTGPGPLKNTWLVTPTSSAPTAVFDVSARLEAFGGVDYAEPVTVIPRGFQTNDSFYPVQWHLNNTGQAGTGSSDIRAEGAWNYSTGEGVNIAIVDSWLEGTHPDLLPNFRADLSVDIIGGAIFDDENHATSVSGVAAARGGNNLGVAGVAHQSSIASVRLINGHTGVSDLQIARAWSHGSTATDAANYIHVSNNSWGPTITYNQVVPLSNIEKNGLITGVTDGRGGLGTVFVFAAGNSGGKEATCDYQGNTASIYTIAVAATTPNGLLCNYSDRGAALFINAPVSTDMVIDTNGNITGNATAGIVTTDRTGDDGYVKTTDPGSQDSTGNYTGISAALTGTSFASPEVAGVAALILKANPALGWRDVRSILAKTATQNDAGDPSWKANAGGLRWSNKYGFGTVNANVAVIQAMSLTPVGPEATPLVATADTGTGVAIPDNDASGATVDFALTPTAAYAVETVEFYVKVVHPRRGQLSYTLVSPSGMEATVPSRKYDNGSSLDWTFTTPAFLGENAAGIWHLKVTDLTATNSGTLMVARIVVHGTTTGSSGGGGGGGGGTGGGIDAGGGTTTPGGGTGGGTNINPANGGNSDGGGGSCGAGSSLAALLGMIGLALGLRGRRQRVAP